jgi:leucyl/phenylalanyl-tRNA--protein transferase
LTNRDFPYLKEFDYFPFPPVDRSSPEGIVASGGNLSPGMLLSAYKQGIFPWYSEHEPILWWSPDPRFILFPENLHISSSMKKVLKKDRFRVTLDRAFHEVIGRCRKVSRKNQDGTWITPDMLEAYGTLHRLGYAHSVEVWEDEKLSGGLYGVSLGNCFFGESMFSDVTNASKTALIALGHILFGNGFFFIDSQVYTPHLATLGCVNIPRSDFFRHLNKALNNPTIKGSWKEIFTVPDTSDILQ